MFGVIPPAVAACGSDAVDIIDGLFCINASRQNFEHERRKICPLLICLEVFCMTSKDHRALAEGQRVDLIP